MRGQGHNNQGQWQVPSVRNRGFKAMGAIDSRTGVGAGRVGAGVGALAAARKQDKLDGHLLCMQPRRCNQNDTSLAGAPGRVGVAMMRDHTATQITAT